MLNLILYMSVLYLDHSSLQEELGLIRSLPPSVLQKHSLLVELFGIKSTCLV